MAESKQLQQENKDREKERIPCRYFIRGSCRKGTRCAYSHDEADIPICRYFLEGSCLYGDKCWFQHPKDHYNMSSSFDEYIVPPESIFSFGNIFSNCPESPPLSNLNLLMAAAISTAWSEVNNSEDKCETPKVSISLEKAIEMWKNIVNADNDRKRQDFNKSMDDSCESFTVLDDINLFFDKLSKFDIKNWSYSDVTELLCLIAEFESEETINRDLSNDLFFGNVLVELLRSWKPSGSITAEYLASLCNQMKIDMTQLIICWVGYPCRLEDFDCFLGEVLYHIRQKNPDVWNKDWLAYLLERFESNLECSDVDAVDVLSSYGRLLNDPAELGEIARAYLEKTGLQNSFECRCKTPECHCPIEVDEGVAFILFDGLNRRLKWKINEKKAFFCKAVDGLFLKGVLCQLGLSMGLTNVGSECKSREEPQLNKVNMPLSKCPNADCSNNAKRDCLNNLCGLCCKRSGLWCDVHVNLFPTRYQTVRAYDLVKPRVNFSTKEDLDSFMEAKEDANAVCFGQDLSVTDNDVIRVIDLCKNLLLLELGSCDTGNPGRHVTNALLKYIARNRPHLRKLRLESATSVNDDGVIELVMACHHLEFLEVSGNDKISGDLTDRTMKIFFDLDVTPSLKTLIITDQQGISYDIVMRLRRCRPNLEITAGETDSDSMAWSLILGMTGGWYGSGLY